MHDLIRSSQLACRVDARCPHFVDEEREARTRVQRAGVSGPQAEGSRPRLPAGMSVSGAVYGPVLQAFR